MRLPSWLGDLVQAEPLLRALHEAYAEGGEEARLSLAAPAHLLPVLDGALPGSPRLAHAGRGGERAEAWRGHDVALLLTGSFRSAWTAWRAGIPRRVGWARDGRASLLTDSLRPARERGAVPLGLGRKGRWPRSLPRPFGATCAELGALLGVLVRDARPRLPVREEALERVRRRLAAEGAEPWEPLLVVNVGARPGSAKGYPEELWARALELLEARGAPRAVVVCGPGEEERARSVAAAVCRARPVVLADPPLDLPELAALASRARAVATADGGARHVAAAVGAPLVCLLGPTDPRHSADHLEETVILRRSVPCGPCHRERCPLGGDEHHRCMREIPPEAVAEAVLGALERR